MTYDSNKIEEEYVEDEILKLLRSWKLEGSGHTIDMFKSIDTSDNFAAAFFLCLDKNTKLNYELDIIWEPMNLYNIHNVKYQLDIQTKDVYEYNVVEVEEIVNQANTLVQLFI